MRSILVSASALVLLGAGQPPQSALDNPDYTTPPERWQTVDDAFAQSPMADPQADVLDPEACRDRITEARDATGQPPLLQREPASPDKPHAIYAVDRQQDGCSVMVMMGDRDDIRPLPDAPEGPVRLMPAEAAQ